jgi:RNA polymerase sigma-70 factor (ECF subfamily)
MQTKATADNKEKEFAIRLKKGDPQSFTLLSDLYRDKLVRFVFRTIGSIEESKDIVQNVFKKIWIERENIDEQKNLNGYIFKIARNCTIDSFRKFSKEKFPASVIISDIIIDIIVAKETPENILLHKEKRLICQEAINQLPSQQKKVCQLHYEQGKQLSDIAKEMKISLSTVQNHINKALKNIREYFAKKNYS